MYFRPYSQWRRCTGSTTFGITCWIVFSSLHFSKQYFFTQVVWITTFLIHYAWHAWGRSLQRVLMRDGKNYIVGNDGTTMNTTRNVGTPRGIVVRSERALAISKVSSISDFSRRAMVIFASVNRLAIGNRNLRVGHLDLRIKRVVVRKGVDSLSCSSDGPARRNKF